MTRTAFCKVSVRSSTALSMLAASLLLAPSPAAALNNNQQVLIGGNSISAGTTLFSAPGLGNQYGPDFPAANLGERSAQVSMPAGVLSGLVVRATLPSVPMSGSLTVMVRVNTANTTLTCQIAGGSGQCSGGAATRTINSGDRLAVRVSNDFTGLSSPITYTYRLIFD